jgi:hypothetical protein
LGQVNLGHFLGQEDLLAPPDPDTRRAALEQGDPVTKTSVKQQPSITLPAALQALRDEIRILDDHVRQALLTQAEADARLAEWQQIKYPPGMHRFDQFALTGVWDEDATAEILRHWEVQDRKEPTQRGNKEYRVPQSTVDAYFGWIVRRDEAYQRRWLAYHPKDAPYLLKLLREKSK